MARPEVPLLQCFVGGCTLLLLAATPPLVQAQTGSRDAQLARGWSEIAAGRAAAAETVADRLLKLSPTDHDAISLAVAAALRGPGSNRALDSYERWLTASKQEDPFLLDEIAVSVLRTLAASDNPRARFTALGALARYGDAAARKEIGALAGQTELSVEAEAALARAGDPSAIPRLRARIAAGGPLDKSEAINALKETGQPGTVDAIAEALSDPAPPSRIAAANALAELGAVEALPKLRAAAADPEPSVRTMVRVALGVLGDPGYRDDAAALATSPLGDFRLLHARAEARRDPESPGWVSLAEALLADEDAAVRLGAADLLMSRGRFDRAEPVVLAALNENAAPIRMIAARLLPNVADPSEAIRSCERPFVMRFPRYASKRRGLW